MDLSDNLARHLWHWRVFRAPIASLFNFAFYFLAAVGVRQRSLPAIAFIAYLSSAIVLHSVGVITAFSLALLLVNVRGIWISSRGSKENTLPPVERLNDTFFDKLCGRWPQVLWPETKWLFAVVATLQLSILALMLVFPQTFHAPAAQSPIR